jgi:plasmid maintenance system antidote protein VapI
MKTVTRTVRPTHPGEMLREDFLPDYHMTVSAFAAALGVSRQTAYSAPIRPAIPIQFGH